MTIMRMLEGELSFDFVMKACIIVAQMDGFKKVFRCFFGSLYLDLT